MILEAANNGIVKNPFETYLDEINEVPLLTKQEEIDLTIRIRAGDQQAREQMIRANLRLVVNIARSYMKLAPIADLIGEGNIGLMTAVDRFDETNGAKFSTYASWWIKNSIRNYIADKFPILHIPRYLKEFSSKLRKVTAVLLTELHTEPTEQQLADAMGLTLVKFKKHQKSLGDSPRRTTIEDDESTVDPFMEIIEDKSPDVTTSRIKAEALERMMYVIMQLSDDERMLLRQRMGILGSEIVPSREVAEAMGITTTTLKSRIKSLLEKIKVLMANGDIPRAIQSKPTAATSSV